MTTTTKHTPGPWGAVKVKPGEIYYGINSLKTTKDWAGLNVMVMKPYAHEVTDLDPLSALESGAYSIRLPSLVMGETFQFLYDHKSVLRELESLRAECDKHPGCVLKWVRHATDEEVERLWKARGEG